MVTQKFKHKCRAYNFVVVMAEFMRIFRPVQPVNFGTLQFQVSAVNRLFQQFLVVAYQEKNVILPLNFIAVYHFFFLNIRVKIERIVSATFGKTFYETIPNFGNGFPFCIFKPGVIFNTKSGLPGFPFYISN